LFADTYIGAGNGARPGGIGMNKRIEVKLTIWQRRRLQQIRDNPPTPRIGKRAVCLLLSADGASNKLISQVTGLSGDAVTDIRRRWHQRGMASLRELSRPGRPPKITAQYRKHIRKALRDGPLSFGYVFTTWSIARLNTHLQNTTGIRVCNDWLRQLIHAEGFVYRRPKYTLKGRRNEKAFRKAQKALNRLKKGL
jgi:transposase